MAIFCLDHRICLTILSKLEVHGRQFHLVSLLLDTFQKNGYLRALDLFAFHPMLIRIVL